MNERFNKILITALYKMMRPLVRIMLRHGVSYRVFADVARHVYVEVATNEFTLPGRKQSASRVSVLTGINRKDIKKIESKPNPLETGEFKEYHRASRLISGWLQDERFHDATGNPQQLALEGDANSFSVLVKEYAKDVPVRALLDELERVGAIKRHSSDMIELTQTAYLAPEDAEEKVRIAARATASLLSTLDHNLNSENTEKLAQRSVLYTNIPVESLPLLREKSKAEIQNYLLHANEWLAEHDRKTNDNVEGTGRAKAGIGLYYFDEIEEEKPEESS